jgi:aspartate racemase
MLTKHLGILGHSAEGAALCFRFFCQLGEGELGEHEHPDVTLDCMSFAPCMPMYDAGDFDSIRQFMQTSLERLALAGADYFVCPDNTVHQAFERPGPDFALPGLHIADVVAEQAKRQGHARVAVLGTRYLMDGPVYPDALGRLGIDAELPDAEDRELINSIIFGELVKGVVTEESRRKFTRVIEKLADRGCDAVALVCTEIPLLVKPDFSPLPTLDSTRLLARAALDVAIGRLPLPDWRGGPLG